MQIILCRIYYGNVPEYTKVSKKRKKNHQEKFEFSQFLCCVYQFSCTLVHNNAEKTFEELVEVETFEDLF